MDTMEGYVKILNRYYVIRKNRIEWEGKVKENSIVS